jgi:hypothetical protein
MMEYLCHVRDAVLQQWDMVEKCRGCDCLLSSGVEHWQKNGTLSTVQEKCAENAPMKSLRPPPGITRRYLIQNWQNLDEDTVSRTDRISMKVLYPKLTEYLSEMEGT